MKEATHGLAKFAPPSRAVPKFAEFLVEQGIDSISLNPDTVMKTTLAILDTEAALKNA